MKAQLVFTPECVLTIKGNQYAVGRNPDWVSTSLELLARIVNGKIEIVQHQFTNAVSRNHAVLQLDRAGYTIMDVGSSYGTAVNKVRLKPGEARLLQHRDIVLLGNVISFIILYP